jgi:hypothetical protein
MLDGESMRTCNASVSVWSMLKARAISNATDVIDIGTEIARLMGSSGQLLTTNDLKPHNKRYSTKT